MPASLTEIIAPLGRLDQDAAGLGASLITRPLLRVASAA